MSIVLLATAVRDSQARVFLSQRSERLQLWGSALHEALGPIVFRAYAVWEIGVPFFPTGRCPVSTLFWTQIGRHLAMIMEPGSRPMRGPTSSHFFVTFSSPSI